eukprot:2059511-Rhodomonas_salina.1
MQTTAQMIAVDHSYRMRHCVHDLVQRQRLCIKYQKPSIDFDFPCNITLVGAAVHTAIYSSTISSWYKRVKPPKSPVQKHMQFVLSESLIGAFQKSIF